MSTSAGIPAQCPPRVVIENVVPEVDGGRFPIKRVVGETVRVKADVFTEGHDRLAAVLCHRRVGDEGWSEVPMRPLGNDRWEAEFAPTRLGSWEYTLEAWVDRFSTWREALGVKAAAGQDVHSELLEGSVLLQEAAERADGDDAALLAQQARELARAGDMDERVAGARSEALARCVARHPDRSRATRYPRVLEVQVERERARAGAWYEFFPRSCAPSPGGHGTLRDCESRLVYAAELGFDVVYLPPIHPIGTSHRKGADNAPRARPEDPGSPWAIGGDAGGHKSVHPELGSIDDFDHLVARARELGLEIALDVAFQCSPDHPWVEKHPEWFRRRPDGAVQYAENPPKKYEDIYPLDFECTRWVELWEELASVVRFWIDHGVTIFRVDNPHTKPFAFWEWLIRDVRRDHPGVVFLAEAFTRPRVMEALAKRGFSQSYTYFTWRNTRADLTRYVEELSRPGTADVMRPNFFANTPDILPVYLQGGVRAAFEVRLVLAATLTGSYGIYGPPFELCVSEALPGTEEYRDSEKYQLRHWDLDAPGSIREVVALVNRIRRENPALTAGLPPSFQAIDNDQLIAYLRVTPDLESAVLVIVNLDPHHTHSGWLELSLEEIGIDERTTYQAHDLLGGGRYLWQGRRNYVSLDPGEMPAHIFRIRRHLRTEADFDYFL